LPEEQKKKFAMQFLFIYNFSFLFFCSFVKIQLVYFSCYIFI